MQRNDSAFGGSATSLEVRYTGKPVSGWGGLVAVMRYLEKRGVRQVLAQALPDGRTSPNQIPVLDSTGVAMEDAVASAAAYEKARAGGIGTYFQFAA